MSVGHLEGPGRIELDRESAVPVYRQIYARVRAAILAGHLPPGARLPSARSLAHQLAIARGTVEAAYDILAGEGYVVGRGAAGTVVDPRLRATPVAGPTPPVAPRRPPLEVPLDRGTAPLPFQMGLPALDAFPRKLWTRLAASTVRGLTTPAMIYQDATGQEALRREIAAYLGIARGIACRPDQVLITAGFQGALGLIARTLLRPGDRVWIEDPGYFLARDALAAAGAELVPVPVDESGLVTATGQRLAPEARLALVTPTHQFPTGATLPVARRLMLLDWASAAGAWIVEDDYDSEFRYQGRPLPALKSLDAADRVLYVGTFSKVLFPSLRLGYLVAPDSILGRLADSAQMLQPAPSALAQTVATRFMAEGHFARHIRRMRRLYAERRAAMVDALAVACGGRLAIAPQAGGMHLLALLADGMADTEIVKRARAHGLAPLPFSCCAVTNGRPGLLIGFTNVPAEAASREALRLRRVLEG